MRMLSNSEAELKKKRWLYKKKPVKFRGNEQAPGLIIRNGNYFNCAQAIWALLIKELIKALQ